MSSPRQKMVIVASPQPNELEQKKRRQTLERAKANHLSKQLQMRLQYAKLKVEHGWQRQNLNEVENLYFHHSHQRTMRQNAAHRSPYTNANVSQIHAETLVIQSPAPASGVPDRNEGPSPANALMINDPSPSGSDSSPTQSPPDHTTTTDSQPSSQSHQPPTVRTPVPVAPASTSTSRPPSAIDLSDPSILARLAQLQAQVQMSLHSQSQTQSLSRQPSTTTLPSTTSQPVITTPGPSVFLPTTIQPPTSHPHPDVIFSPFVPHTIAGTPPGTATYLIPTAPPPNPGLSQPAILPIPASTPTPTSIPVPTMTSASILATPISTVTSIAPAALTYDSFWSTHASTTGPTRTLYRTHTGFSASTTQGGNVAMLTPGGHAAVMTAEGVYVGGGSGRTG